MQTAVRVATVSLTICRDAMMDSELSPKWPREINCLTIRVELKGLSVLIALERRKQCSVMQSGRLNQKINEKIIKFFKILITIIDQQLL